MDGDCGARLLRKSGVEAQFLQFVRTLVGLVIPKYGDGDVDDTNGYLDTDRRVRSVPRGRLIVNIYKYFEEVDLFLRFYHDFIARSKWATFALPRTVFTVTE